MSSLTSWPLSPVSVSSAIDLSCPTWASKMAGEGGMRMRRIFHRPQVGWAAGKTVVCPRFPTRSYRRAGPLGRTSPGRARIALIAGSVSGESSRGTRHRAFGILETGVTVEVPFHQPPTLHTISPMIRRPYYNSRAPVTRERVLAFLAERRLAQARTLCARLCAARKKNPPAWILLGRIDAQLGRWPAVEQSLRRAVELEPGNADAWHGLGRAIHHQGRYAEAEDAYRQALRLGLSDANNILVDLGAVCYCQRKLTDAEDCFRRAAELRPQDSEAHFRLAEICEQTHRPAEARHAAEAACRLNAGHHRARLLLARLHRHAGALANARSLAEDVLKTAERPLASLATIELGHILDSAGEYRRAFVHLARGQREFSETFGAGIDRQSYPREIARNRAWFTAQRVVGWERDPAPDDRPDPVFLVGFPRSGTTLTERILSSHSAVTCLDERPLLDMLITELPGGPDHDTAYPDCLTDLSTAQIQALRTRYHELSAAARGAADGGLLVDKFPLNLVHLGLVARLFPNARVLMALRDPRDVCLSCFMQ
ncbi:MAG TPA: tetratricopeptide repeat protein, partial [Chromatiales bacterium]|nr:tetratricopeptide repeat protein [Chromatiales bacterium]